MIVVSDTSPDYKSGGDLDLLQRLYSRIIIPVAVYNEMVEVGKPVPGAVEVQTLSWIQTQAVMDRERAIAIQASEENIHLGEAEAIALALELKADLLLMDERRGRIVATSYGLQVTGLLGVLVQAKRNNLIEAVKPLVDRAIEQADFRVSDRLYANVLEIAGE